MRCSSRECSRCFSRVGGRSAKLSFEPALEAAERALAGLDTVVVTAALFGTQEALEADAKQRHTLLTANFVHTVQFCEAARARLLARGGGPSA